MKENGGGGGGGELCQNAQKHFIVKTYPELIL